MPQLRIQRNQITKTGGGCLKIDSLSAARHSGRGKNNQKKKGSKKQKERNAIVVGNDDDDNGRLKKLNGFGVVIEATRKR